MESRKPRILTVYHNEVIMDRNHWLAAPPAIGQIIPIENSEQFRLE